MHRNNSEQLPDRRLRAQVNRHAISLTGHLLMAGIWVERRLMKAPRPGFRLVSGSGTTRTVDARCPHE